MIWSQFGSAEFWLVAVSCAGIVLVGAMTRAVNIPLNKQLMTWNVDTPPSNLKEIWAPWDRVNTIRTLVATTVLLLETVALSLAPIAATPRAQHSLPSWRRNISRTSKRPIARCRQESYSGLLQPSDQSNEPTGRLRPHDFTCPSSRFRNRPLRRRGTDQTRELSRRRYSGASPHAKAHDPRNEIAIIHSD
jgi:hypothetical protein